MKKIKSTVWLTVVLTMISCAIYGFQLIKFHAPRDTAFYFLQDMAFLPLQVLIVTILLARILSDREKKERFRKTNMMVGAFFTEMGNQLLEQLNQLNGISGELQPRLRVTESWSDRDFKNAVTEMKRYNSNVQCTNTDLQNLRILLSEKRHFLLIMIQNPNLLEHELFTDMLWSVFHLTDELVTRECSADLHEDDIKHLNGDVKRVYNTMLVQWISYMAHLKSDYPYLFSLEVRRNPFGGVRI